MASDSEVAPWKMKANNDVRIGDFVIGKRTSDGVGTNELIVAFNNKATPSLTQLLVRGITFRTVGGSTGKRSVLFTISDGDGGLSAERTVSVNVN